MDKSDWNILISVLILCVSAFGVYLTYSYGPSATDLAFFAAEVHEEDGKSVEWSCSLYECQFLSDEVINPEDTYYTTTIFMDNRGKRAHNVIVDFYCEDIDYVGINKGVNSDFEIRRLYDWSTVLYFDEVDNINFKTWDIVYKVDESVESFTCHIEFASDEVDMGEKDIIIDVT